MERMQLFAGLDVHKDSITGTVKDCVGNSVRVLKVETSKEGVKRLFDGFKKSNVKVVFEATRNWHYYAELLRPYCDHLVMAHLWKAKVK